MSEDGVMMIAEMNEILCACKIHTKTGDVLSDTEISLAVNKQA